MQALIIYWFLFWQKFLRNPFLLSTSELATTNFPFWIWMGRSWRSTDNLYYRYPASIPFMSMWYLPNVLISKLSRYLSLDNAFRLYVYFILLHYLLASIIAYKVLGLFGAITLTYAGYCIKPQTPSFVYTMCWMPGMLIDGPIGWLSCAMAITGGYWPILVYFMPVAVFLNPGCLWGLLLTLPQLLLFYRYFKLSVRWNQPVNSCFGKLPWHKLTNLFWPTNSVSLVNGVHYPEAEMYMGLAILFIWQFSWWWIPLLITCLVCVGLLPSIQHIPARALYVLTLSIASLSISSEISIALILLQGFLLLRNSSIYPSFPFSQWWDKPSKLYPAADYTGYLTETKLHDYKGAFALR